MYIKRSHHPAAAPDYAVCFDPGTLAIVATVIGTAVSTVGAIRQGKAASAQSNCQAGILRQQATRERQQAKADEGDFRRRLDRLFAARRAGLGASGVDPSTGSPLLVSEDFAAEVELNALRIRSGGKLRGTRLEQQAGLEQFRGRTAQRAGFFRAGSLLITGAGKSFTQLKSLT